MKLVVRTRVLIGDCPLPVSEESTSTGHCLVRALTVRKDLSICNRVDQSKEIRLD